MNFKFIYIGLIFSLIFTSCNTDDNENVVEIPFTRVVGSYQGFSKKCVIVPGETDTTCGPELSNTLKVILYNQNTIIVSDAKGVFTSINLIFESTTIENGKRFFNFRTNLTGIPSTLKYNDTDKSILLEDTIPNDISVMKNYFAGVK